MTNKKLYVLLIFFGLYPGLFLYSTEIGLSATAGTYEQLDYKLAAIYKWVYILTCFSVISLKMKPFAMPKWEAKYLSVALLMNAALYLTDSEIFIPDDGYYLIYWACFAWAVIKYLMLPERMTEKLISMLAVILAIDVLLTILTTSGGGIFHQHRFSGVLAFLIALYLFELIVQKDFKLNKSTALLLVLLSFAAILTTVYVHTTRQMLLYVLASFCLAVWCYWHQFFVIKNWRNEIYHKKNNLFGLSFIVLILILIAIIPFLHLAGSFGDIAYTLSSVIGKDRSVDQEGGREGLFISLVIGILDSDLQWTKPIDFSGFLIGGAVSAHNAWVQTYIQFGLIFTLFFVAFWINIIFIIARLIVSVNALPRFIIVALTGFNLMIFGFNDEGWFYTRAPAVSLWLIVMYSLWLRVKSNLSTHFVGVRNTADLQMS